MNFSIVIVTYNRRKHLERCLNSIIYNPSLNYNFEVIIIFNGETSYLTQIKNKFPQFYSFYIPTCSPAQARNIGIEKAKGDYLFFLDDDCYLPKDYFSKIDFNQDWDVIGGPDKTPVDATPFQRSLGYTLSSPFCMGETYKRHTINVTETLIKSSESHLILCNLWFKRSLFSLEKYSFSTDLFRNEENFLLKELKQKSKKIYYNPSLFVFHSRKDNLKALAGSIFKSGECRVKSFYKLPNKSEFVYFSPLAFLLCFLFWVFNPYSVFVYPLIGYTIIISINTFITQRIFDLKIIFLHYFILITYALGLISGVKNTLEQLWVNAIGNQVL